MIIVADHFDMDRDWSGSIEASLTGISSTDPRGNKWASIGVNYPAVINQASALGDPGRGLRFQVAQATALKPSAVKWAAILKPNGKAGLSS